MSAPRLIRARALPIVGLAAIAGSFLAISPVMADTQIAHHGKTGVGSVNEAQDDVVGQCP
ncbi:MAG TPA: hypothetical protein VIK08_09305 [Candidatus Limnocylindrales bacterium]